MTDLVDCGECLNGCPGKCRKAQDREKVASPGAATREGAEPSFYVRDSDVEALKDRRIAGRGAMLHKEPGEGRSAYYTTPPAPTTEPTAHPAEELLTEIRKALNASGVWHLGMDTVDVIKSLIASRAAQQPVQEGADALAAIKAARVQALEEIKAIVCDVDSDRWKGSDNSYRTRQLIADLCDGAGRMGEEAGRES